MNPIPLYQTLARYNRWMNDKLYDACAALPDEERKRDRRAPFGSLHGTFNHLLLTDRIWLGRFTGQPFAYGTLSDELFADWDELRRERAFTDDAIQAWAATLCPSELAADFRFMRQGESEPIVRPLWLLAGHLFNHQTHHRGQITTLLEQAGVDFGVTDLGRMPFDASQTL